VNKMDDNELRNGWLNNLKVGDEVAIYVCKNNNWVVKKIKSISKDGFRLEGNHPVWNDGTYMGNYAIYPCTEKINNIIEKSELIKVLSNYNISRLDIEKLREIRRIIEGN